MKRELLTLAILLTLIAIPFCFAATAVAEEPPADTPTDWPTHAGPPFSQRNLMLFYTRLWQLRHDGVATPEPEPEPEAPVFATPEPEPDLLAGVDFNNGNVYLSVEQAIEVLTRARIPSELHSQFLRVWWLENGQCYCTAKVGDSGRALGAFQLHWYSTWAPYALRIGRLWPGDYDGWAHPVVNAIVAYATYQYDLGRGHAPFTQWTQKPWY